MFRVSGSQAIQLIDIQCQHFTVECILMVSPFFLRLYQLRFNQNLNMMGDRWLRQVNNTCYIRTLPASSLVRNELENLQAIAVS